MDFTFCLFLLKYQLLTSEQRSLDWVAFKYICHSFLLTGNLVSLKVYIYLNIYIYISALFCAGLTSLKDKTDPWKIHGNGKNMAKARLEKDK